MMSCNGVVRGLGGRRKLGARGALGFTARKAAGAALGVPPHELTGGANELGRLVE